MSELDQGEIITLSLEVSRRYADLQAADGTLRSASEAHRSASEAARQADRAYRDAQERLLAALSVGA